MGLTCCAAPLFVIGVLVLALSGRLQRADDPTKHHAPQAQRLVGIGMIVASLIAGILFEPFFEPDRYVHTIEKNAAPLVSAIDAYDADHGAPPDDLGQLVPKYLERIPGTGYRGSGTFRYSYVSSLTQPRYRLTIPVGFSLDHDPGFYFDSWSRRWGYSDD